MIFIQAMQKWLFWAKAMFQLTEASGVKVIDGSAEMV